MLPRGALLLSALRPWLQDFSLWALRRASPSPCAPGRAHLKTGVTASAQSRLARCSAESPSEVLWLLLHSKFCLPFLLVKICARVSVAQSCPTPKPHGL